MIGSNIGLGGQSSVKKPQYISDDSTESAVNNVMAQGISQGDQRFQLKQLDRQGFSRGRGQQYMAAQSGQQSLAQSSSQAAGLRAEDQALNAGMRSDYENMREREAMSSATNAHERSQADWSVNFARRQQQLGLLRQSLMRT